MKKIWQLLQMRNWKRITIVGTIVAAVVAAIASYGPEEFTGQSAEKTTAESTVAEVQEELPVSEEEAALLGTLYRALLQGKYDVAASVLNENEQAFDALMKDTLAGELYCYQEKRSEDGTQISKMERVLSSATCNGMVLTRYNTVFYGAFSGGKPEGKVTAIQAMVLDEPRYSYAIGSWTDGKMNGEGCVGYRYYMDAPASRLIRTEKRGNFRDNLLDGDFVYETESGNGETLSWKMKAINGVTVLTPAWEYYPYRNEYMLGSSDDAGRAYVLSEDKVATVLWNNLIQWPE